VDISKIIRELIRRLVALDVVADDKMSFRGERRGVLMDEFFKESRKVRMWRNRFSAMQREDY